MFKEKLALVPHQPGSYQMKNAQGTIIYVGKAKDLHKRLSSYFNRAHTGKTAKMVSEIADFTYIVASSELEAFIIEINLIKQYDPKYNILLTDDKTYPYIEYSRNPYPHLRVARYIKLKKDPSKKIFGPYPNSYAARHIVNLLNRLYPLKKCQTTPKEVCLYYHIGECLGYCCKNIPEEQILKMEKEILSFLRGNDEALKNKIIEKINFYSENLNYEMALDLKRELDNINIIMSKQKVELHDLINRDICGYYYNNGYLSIELFFLRNGKLVGQKNEIFPIINEPIDELEYYLSRFYLKNEIPQELFIPEELNHQILTEVINTKVITPQKGTKKDLLLMANKNAQHNLEREMTLLEKNEQRSIQANEELKELLNLKQLERIDIFDNSNLFGNFSVSGMVVFKNGQPAKKEYRKYKITVDKNDDYHTMQEVIYRRYYRALIEKSELPDLIIVDGGENQINAAKETLCSLNLPITVCGLKKNKEHRTNELINSNLLPLAIDKTSNLFHYLTRMQDEVHRYTINYHRTIRSKGSISSILDNIPGIGPKRKKAIIKKYGSINNIKQASIQELQEHLPQAVATELKKYLDSYKK